MYVLLLIATLELVINRVLVPMLRPPGAVPPDWHVALDYLGLFLFYFTGALAALILGVRCRRAFAVRRGARDLIIIAAVAAPTVLAAIQLVVSVPELALPLELALAVAVLALIAAAFGRHHDPGIQAGVPIVAAPLVLHVLNVLGDRFRPEAMFDGVGLAIAHGGAIALSIAALASPYCFAPRPFARAVTRPAPVLVAMAITAVAALCARAYYADVATAVKLAIGIELGEGPNGRADPRLAFYMLAVATLVWTLVSCARAATPARRTVGIGLALIVLGGYVFHGPHNYLLPVLGLVMMTEVARRVREEELAALPIASETPTIADATWAAYVTAVTQALRRTLGEVHSLTTRGEGGLVSSLIVADANSVPMRTRIERIDGSVLALDIVFGREIDELRGATLTLWAIPPRALGINPAGPPATPPFKTGDAELDARFKTRGNTVAFAKLFDDGLRARAVATLDGWLAYWEADGLRYRVYPGRGAPLDHPMPLSDLALGRTTATPERLVAVIELLAEIAARGVVVAPIAEPTELDVE